MGGGDTNPLKYADSQEDKNLLFRCLEEGKREKNIEKF